MFEQIVKGGYVAQAFAPPGERMMRVEGVTSPRKVDVRLYAYAGKVLLAAARELLTNVAKHARARNVDVRSDRALLRG